MRFERRTFLGWLSSAPLIFGLDDLHARPPRPANAPPWWREALGRMKDLGRPGLVLIGPTGDKALDELGFALRDLLEGGDSRAREIFCAAVVVCLHADVAPSCLPDGGSPGRVVVLDPDGRTHVKVDLRMDGLATPEAFDESMAPLIHGEGHARLAAAAEGLRRKLSVSDKAALADLAAEDVETRERASRALASRAEALMPLLVFERKASRDAERIGRLRRIIDARFEASDEKSPGPRLPFGSKYEADRGG